MAAAATAAAAAAATLNSHQMWVPYDTPKDCSQGFCSIYCPQWCYIIFPPPPPFGFDSAYTSSSTTAFSPLVIAIIGVLASAFLLVSYYTIISKYCGTFATIRHRLRRHTVTPADTDGDGDGDGDDANPSLHHEPTWHISPSNGLEETLISKITLYRYKHGEGVVDGTDCSVCLSEFCEDESLRLLPKCSHAFHLQCIDTWLRSHSNCPLCRANIVSVVPPTEIETTNAPTTEVTEVVVLIEDVDSGTEDQDPAVDLDDGACKDIVEVVRDEFRPVRRSFSMDSSSHSRLSIADVLLTSIEDELSAAKEQGCFSEESGSSRRMVGELSKGRCRSLHCVMSPVPMKRSFSSGRFCFARGRNSVLPL